MALAVTLGAITTGHDAAIAAGARVIGGDGQVYQPPGQFSFAVLKSVQNVIVHFNLFLLPVVLAAMPAPQPEAPPRAAPQKAKVRRKRARGRR